MKKINFKHPCKNCICLPVCKTDLIPGDVFSKLDHCELFRNYFSDVTTTIKFERKKIEALKDIKTYVIFGLGSSVNKYLKIAFCNLKGKNNGKDKL